jgi:competence protein ComGC
MLYLIIVILIISVLFNLVLIYIIRRNEALYHTDVRNMIKYTEDLQGFYLKGEFSPIEDLF